MSIRSKMVCNQASDGRIVLQVVTSGSDENEAFFAATPCGTLDLSVLRPDVVALLEPGAEYYVSIEPVSGEWTQRE